MKKHISKVLLLSAVVFFASSCHSVRRSGCPGRDYSSYKMNKHRFGQIMITLPENSVQTSKA